MNRNLERSMTHLARVLEPPAVLQQREATSRAIDATTGRLTSPALADTHDPQTIKWDSTDTEGDFAVRAGTAILIRARATTAPTTGDALITITKETEFGGAEALGVVTIPKNSNWGAAVVSTPVEAGAFFSRAVTSAQGASGITTQLVLKAGS